MEAAESILVEVNKQANLRHSEVLREGFRLSGTMCANCNFPSNATEFQELLHSYIFCKQELHRSGCRDMQMSCRRNTNRFWDDVHRMQRYVSAERNALKKIWPCQLCLLRYNPTLRIKQGSRKWPQLREDIFCV